VNVNQRGHQASLGGHQNPTPDFYDLTVAARLDRPPYSRSKMAETLFTYEPHAVTARAQS